MLCEILLLFCLLCGLAAADGGPLYRRRAHHSIAILGDYLFVDGGDVSEYIDGVKPEGSDHATAIKNTTLIPLNSKWTPSDVHNLYRYAEYPAEIQPASNFILWTNPDKNELYRWAGTPARGYSIKDRANNSMGVLVAAGKEGMQWKITSANDQSHPPGKDGAPVSCNGLGLFFGGYSAGDTVKDDRWIIFQGVLTYNMTESTWGRNINRTMDLNSRRNEFGEAICIEGLLDSPMAMLFGGSFKNETDVAEYNNLTHVTLYDPVSQMWYDQQTIGAQPEPRNSFCAVGAESQNGTYEIFIFGGRGLSYGVQKICILSLPGFYWFCPRQFGVDSDIRTRHRCARIGNRQMISVGGLGEWRVKNQSWKWPDTWPNGIGIFDLTELKWKDEYDPDAKPYESPQIVQEWYAAKDRQQVAWASPQLEALFNKKSSIDTTQTTPVPTTPAPTMTDSTMSDSQTHKSRNLGPIVGGVVGGVSFLVLLVAALWVLKRRRSLENLPVSPNDEQHKTELSYWPGGYLKPSTNELDGTVRSELEPGIKRSLPGSYMPQREPEIPIPLELEGSLRHTAPPRLMRSTSNHF